MAVRIINASRDMDSAAMQGLVPEISTLFEKLVKRFPSDVTVGSLWDDCLSGRKELWLVFDGSLKALAMTQVKTVVETQTRIACLMDLAGEDIPSWADELGHALEEWGRSHGVDYYSVEGRPGWGPILKKLGYREYAVLWRKVASHDAGAHAASLF